VKLSCGDGVLLCGDRRHWTAGSAERGADAGPPRPPSPRELNG